MASPTDPSPFSDRVPFARDCPSTSATTTYAIASIVGSSRLRIERAELIVDATYTADATNFYVFTLQHGATVIATWSTQVGQQGTITGGTPAQMVLAADTANNLVVQPGESLTLVATKAAAGANVTPRIVAHGRYVQ
jgi:hypothetical protein